MRFFVSIFIIALPLLVSGQKHDYTWLFGYESDLSQAGIEGAIMDFNNSPVSITAEDLGTSMYVSSAMISDTSGNLLFYTDGCRVYNANHEILENGEGINPGEVHDIQCDGSTSDFGYTAGRQSSLILPHPTNDSLYYLFHKHIVYQYEPEFDVITDGLFYTVINPYENDGQGIVLEKNIPIIEENLSYGELTATKHANGNDWWILTTGLNVNKYYSILFNGDTIKIDTTFELGAPISGGGQVNFSPNGKRYARYNSQIGLQLFDFDRNSGILSNYQTLNIIRESLSDGVAFSPNSQLMYVCTYDTIFQYDLEVQEIESSKETVSIYDGFMDLFYVDFHNAQLAPDCKIYINTFAAVHYLHVIHNPDEKGLACNVEQHAIELPYRHLRTIPHYPNYRLGPLIEGEAADPPCQLIVNVQEEPPLLDSFDAYIFPNPASDYIKVSMLQALSMPGDFLLYTQLGAEVFSSNLPKGEGAFQLEVGHLPAGLYFYNILLQGRQVKSGKIVISR